MWNSNCSIHCFYGPPIENLILCCTVLLKFRIWWDFKQGIRVGNCTHQPSLLCTSASYAKFSTIAPDCTAAQTQFKSKVKCQLCLLKFPKCENWIIDPQVIFSFLQGVKGVALDKWTCNSHVWTGLCTALHKKILPFFAALVATW